MVGGEQQPGPSLEVLECLRRPGQEASGSRPLAQVLFRLQPQSGPGARSRREWSARPRRFPSPCPPPTLRGLFCAAWPPGSRGTPRRPDEKRFGGGERCSQRHRAWQGETLGAPPSPPRHRAPRPLLSRPETLTTPGQRLCRVDTPSPSCARKGRGVWSRRAFPSGTCSERGWAGATKATFLAPEAESVSRRVCRQAAQTC